MQNTQGSCDRGASYPSSLLVKSPYLIFSELWLPGQEVVDLYLDRVFTNDKVCTPWDGIRSNPLVRIGWYNAAIHIEFDSRRWGPRLYNKGPFFGATDWSPKLVIAWWRFNVYYHPPTSFQLVCISTCANIKPTRMHYKTLTWHRPPFEPVGKRWSNGTCIRVIETFGLVLTEINRFADGIYRECISQFTWDKHHTRWNSPWYWSFDSIALNLIHLQTQSWSCNTITIFIVNSVLNVIWIPD